MKQTRSVSVVRKLRTLVVSLALLAGVIALVFAIGESHLASRATTASANQRQQSTGSAATVGQSSPVDQQAMQACIAQPTVNCEASVPGLAQCMAARRTDCNQAAAQQMIPAQIGSTSGAPMAEATAISEARRLHPGTASAPALVKQMSLSQYTAAEPNEAGAFPGLSSARMVWVVTIHASVLNDPLPGQTATLEPYYTVVFDVASGQTLVECIGCETAG